jgi:hypothetical protein
MRTLGHRSERQVRHGAYTVEPGGIGRLAARNELVRSVAFGTLPLRHSRPVRAVYAGKRVSVHPATAVFDLATRATAALP